MLFKCICIDFQQFNISLCRWLHLKKNGNIFSFPINFINNDFELYLYCFQLFLQQYLCAVACS